MKIQFSKSETFIRSISVDTSSFQGLSCVMARSCKAEHQSRGPSHAYAGSHESILTHPLRFAL
jgi:hypothetical protein